jgi:hypothetical protein
MIPPPPHPPAGGEGGGGPSNPSWAELRRAVGRVGVTLCHPPPQTPTPRRARLRACLCVEVCGSRAWDRRGSGLFLDVS